MLTTIGRIVDNSNMAEPLYSFARVNLHLFRDTVGFFVIGDGKSDDFRKVEFESGVYEDLERLDKSDALDFLSLSSDSLRIQRKRGESSLSVPALETYIGRLGSVVLSVRVEGDMDLGDSRIGATCSFSSMPAEDRMKEIRSKQAYRRASLEVDLKRQKEEILLKNHEEKEAGKHKLLMAREDIETNYHQIREDLLSAMHKKDVAFTHAVSLREMSAKAKIKEAEARIEEVKAEREHIVQSEREKALAEVAELQETTTSASNLKIETSCAALKLLETTTDHEIELGNVKLREEINAIKDRAAVEEEIAKNEHKGNILTMQTNHEEVICHIELDKQKKINDANRSASSSSNEGFCEVF